MGSRHSAFSSYSTLAKLLQFPGSRAWLSSCGAWAYCFTACGIFLDQKSSNLHLLQWHANSHPLCQQGSPLCAHIFNVPNCISFSCLPLALNKVATGLHRYSLYSLSICAPRERHRLMTFAHWIMLQNPHACSLRDWSDISSSFIPRNGTAAPWGLWFVFFLNRTKY